MKIGQSINSALKLAILCACIYGIVQWQRSEPKADENADIAERVCVDAIRARYHSNTVRPYAVNRNSDGYVVHASISLENGASTKVYCLTSDQGSVRDVGIKE
jgi:hypothetical protein